jgi:hypothetical protein
VNILLLFGGLLTALMIAAFSCARSYFDQGRLHGMEEALRELSEGIKSHFEEGGHPPKRVVEAFEDVRAIVYRDWKRGKGSVERYHAQLWILGDAIGESCWLKGHRAGISRKAPAEGKIRVDMTVNDLLQLSWLAHLGFQRMMPNFRDFDQHRFSGEGDANEGALAVSVIETAIPLKDRPFDLRAQLQHRQSLIGDWWRVALDRHIA